MIDVPATVDNLSPMMQQYINAKNECPGILMFFRMGDFYELFFEDAKLVASELNLALTSRGKIAGDNIPMCGVPVVSVDYYLAKLVKLGYKIGICEQLESPEDAKKRGYKAIVNRGITRIVTPGTVTEETFLTSKEDNFLMSIVPNIKKAELVTISFAVADISTDKFFVNTVSPTDFLSALERYSPKEVLISSNYENAAWFRDIKQYIGGHITTLSESKFNNITEEQRLKKYYQVAALDSFGLNNSYEISACGVIIEYVTVTQCTNKQQLSHPIKTSQSQFMIIDSATHKNLEIIHSQDNDKNSLFYCIDSTVTAFGGRLLCNRLVTPILDISALNSRLNSVEFFVSKNDLRNNLRDILKTCPDIERTIVRMRFGKYSTRDLSSIRQGLYAILNVIKALNGIDFKLEDSSSVSDLPDLSDLYNRLSVALVDEIPPQYKPGHVVKAGYSAQLDEVKSLVENGYNLITDLQAKYASQSNITSLKINNNNILGWYIEIPLSQKSKMGVEFIHKQTLVNNVRYTTIELNELQIKLSQASDNLVKVENEIISNLVNEIISKNVAFEAVIAFMAKLDVALSMAHIARDRGYVKPDLSSDHVLVIKQGRHPVLELIVDDFVANDCSLSDPSRLSILTGPNMSGKSTYLRQNALIVLMAHVGAFVPADKAVIGITDRLFSRIGASDDLAKGRSTFMIEMIETASILNQATDKSFVILDEVGRGTSTYDGISIAWSVVDYLYNTNKCRTIFATHYMELTSIKRDIPHLKCQTLKIQEWKGNVVFHHTIIDGTADRSYGVYVAKLAGLPKIVVNKANSILRHLEKNHMTNAIQIGEQLSMFAGQKIDENTNENYDEIISKLSQLNTDNLTPKQALEILYEIKAKLKCHT